MRDLAERFADEAAVLQQMGDPHAYRQYIAGALPDPPESPFVPTEAEQAPAERTLPAVPSWVRDPAKWVTLSRADRRALERHHRKQLKG